MRNSTRDRRLTTTIALIRDERNAAKLIERHLGVSPAQADRIVKTGRAPNALRAAWLAFLKGLREKNRAKLAQYDEEIRALEYQEMVARAASRRSSAMGGSP